MLSSKFIESEINTLLEMIPEIRASYQFDEECRTHFIKVEPLSIYNESQKYIDWEIDTLEKFSLLFSNESMCFLSSESFVEVESPTQIFEGEGFIKIPSWLDYDLLANGPSFFLTNSNSLIFKHRESEECEIEVISVNDLTQIFAVDFLDERILVAGESNFAMAA